MFIMLSLPSSVIVTLVSAGILINASSHTFRSMWTSNFYEASMNNRVFRTGTSAKDVATNIRGKNLRILPLGDSITNGWRSTDGNGYRLDLLNQLSSSNTVEYIGSVSAGTMTNPQCEGHNGATIAQISSFANLSLSERPNVVLLMAGTNDMNIPFDPDTAPDRLGDLIDQIAISCPDAAILVAQLIHSGYVGTNTRITTYNSALVGVVAQRAKAGKHVLLATGMSDALNKTSQNDYADDLHPNDSGYQKIANVWYNYLNIANSNGWINGPVAVASSGTVLSNTTVITTAITQITSSVPSSFTTRGSGIATGTQSASSVSVAPTTRSRTVGLTAGSTSTLASIVSTANAGLKTLQPLSGLGFASILLSFFF